jgi:uncharacterized membrane protein
MNYFTAYIYLIFLIKIGFILMAMCHTYLKLKGNINSDLDKKFIYWKERFEFIFIFLMSLLLMYLFYPNNDKPVIVGGELKILFYLFGIVLFITAKYELFLKESIWFKNIQPVV